MPVADGQVGLFDGSRTEVATPTRVDAVGRARSTSVRCDTGDGRESERVTAPRGGGSPCLATSTSVAGRTPHSPVVPTRSWTL